MKKSISVDLLEVLKQDKIIQVKLGFAYMSQIKFVPYINALIDSINIQTNLKPEKSIIPDTHIRSLIVKANTKYIQKLIEDRLVVVGVLYK